MLTWDPAATRAPLPDAGDHLAGPYRIVLHTTEGNSYAGALAAYRANRVAPHFTASYEGGRFRHWQHIAINRSASALRHPAGTVHTNRLSAIQIEVVARAANPIWPEGLVVGVADLVAWVMEQTGVQAVAPHFEAYPASYGLHNGLRFSEADWLTFNGVCGHQHVPGNDHGDPGAINVAALLPTPKVQRPVSPPPGVVYDYEELAVKTTMMHIGPLDKDGNGWADWQVGLGRDPIPVSVVLRGPSPPDDGYWPDEARVQLSAQPRGESLRVVVRNGLAGDTITCFVAVA